MLSRILAADRAGLRLEPAAPIFGRLEDLKSGEPGDRVVGDGAAPRACHDLSPALSVGDRRSRDTRGDDTSPQRTHVTGTTSEDRSR